MIKEIRFSFFDHARDNKPQPVTMTWDQFVQDLARGHRTDIADKRRVPAFSPAEFRAPRRLEKNVARVWFGVLDLDGITAAQLSQVCAKLDGLDAILYTTWGHPTAALQGRWKVRVCIRFSRPAELLEWPIIWPAMSAYFCGLNDTSMNSANELYFVPSVPPGTDPAACHVIVFQGGALNLDDLPVQVFGEGSPGATFGGGTEKITRERLERLATRWKRAKDPYRSEMGEALTRVCKGDVFAELGRTDTFIFQLTNDLARALPEADPASVAEHFAHSLQIMASEKGVYPTERVAEKFARAQERVASEAFAAEMASASERKQRIRQAFAHIDPARESSYTEDELAEMAEVCKCTREELRKRWIIQRGSLFYVLGPLGVYSPAYTDKDVYSAVLRDLAPADSAGVDLWTLNASGEPMRKGLITLMNEYGQVATEYVLDMRAQTASYDAAQRLFIEAPCPVRNLVPAWDPDVAAWLEVLTGPHYPNVQNWIAQITDLNLTCAALMLTGPKDTGKSLLAFGLARLWTVNGPTPLVSALADFNDRLARCPLSFADEELPKDFRGHGRTAEIREWLSAMVHPFKKKFYPEASILGAVRLMVAANNDQILSIQEHLTANDIDAIGDRFYHVRVNDAPAYENGRIVLGSDGQPVPQPAYFLRMCDAASFVNQDRIARHALYLRDHYPIRRDGRFLIKSLDREFYRGLATQTGIRSAVCQWFVSYLRNPGRIDARGDFGVQVKHGKLYVSPETVLECWDVYVRNEPAPTLGKLAQAITELSVRRTRLSRPVGGVKHYREIDTDHLFAWAERCEIATRDEITAALSQETGARAIRALN